MKICVNNIKCKLKEGVDYAFESARKKAGVKKHHIKTKRINKKSVDARNKKNIHFVYSVILDINDGVTIRNNKNITKVKDINAEDIKTGKSKLNTNPIIVGSGPAGLFAGLLLARYGYNPVIVEKGDMIKERVKKVNRYWQEDKLDVKCNVQFGEGGAGTFSDGKLTTGIKHPFCDYVLESFVKYGAPKEITYLSKPHIGTDNLRKVIVNMRNDIIKMGGKFLFNTCMNDVHFRENKVKGITLNDTVKECEVLILAVGHSSRDTFNMLLNKGLMIKQKPMAVGVRIEHSQQKINYAQYGEYGDNEELGAADYKLSAKFDNKGIYTFCMCPGGKVVAAASEPESIVTNGMSYFNRGLDNANSALVVSVNQKDYKSKDPLAGVEFQRMWEKAAYKIGKGSAPVQKVGDFLKDKKTVQLGSIKPSYTGDIKLTSLKSCLPEYITEILKKGISYFDTKISGFADEDAILTGVETRTSSPVRILRDDDFQCEKHPGIYPAGEGAGYAGGIVSAAVDGLKIAKSIIQRYSPLM